MTVAGPVVPHGGRGPAPLEASVFYGESVRAGQVWAVRDAGGFLVPEDPHGVRAMPYWSDRSRLDRVLSTAPAYRRCQAVEVPLAVWRTAWLPGMACDGLLVGLNWAGSAVSGCAVTPAEVQSNLSVRERTARR